MLTKEEISTLTEHWIAAWNAHDLDQIMAHYEDNVVLINEVLHRKPQIGILCGGIALKPWSGGESAVTRRKT